MPGPVICPRAGSIPARPCTGRGGGTNGTGSYVPLLFLEYVMDIETFECTASVWPHRHKDEYLGPLDLSISYTNQPPLVQHWMKREPSKIQLEQPDEKTNLTVIHLAFNLPPEEEWADHYIDGLKWFNINYCRISRGHGLKLYIRSRIINKMDHPIPRGRWPGVCKHTDKWCLYTFQAMTMAVKSNIILPEGGIVP